MAERRKPRGRMPAKIKCTVRFVQGPKSSWEPLVRECMIELGQLPAAAKAVRP